MNTFGYVIVFVSDMDKSVAFYRDVLGFPLKHQSHKWTEFDTGETTLALHLAEASGHAHAHAAMPAGHCHVGLTVPDVDAFHQEDFLSIHVISPRFRHGLRQQARPRGTASG